MCEPGVPRAHGTTCPTPPTQISTPSPKSLMCPITRAVFRDPVMLFDSGHTYERSAILSHFERNGAKDPLTRRALSSTKVMTNWAMRNVVQAWLDKHPGVTPDGWDSRELLEPSKDDGTRTSDDEGDVGVLRTWRAMCPELQERWPEDEQPEDWEGVTIENGRVVQLNLEELGLTGAVPAEIGRLSALTYLNFSINQLTSVPAEIGQLAALEQLYLSENQVTSLPAEMGQLTSLEWLSLSENQTDELACGDRAAHVAEGVVPHRQSADEPAGGDRAAHIAGAVGPRRQSADDCAGGDRAAHGAEGVVARRQSADERAGGDRAAHLAGEVEPLRQSADEVAGGDRAAHVAGGVVALQQSADKVAGRDRAAHIAEGVEPRRQSADDCAGGDRAARGAAGVVPRRQSADERAGGDTWAQSGRLLRASGYRREGLGFRV